MNEANLLRHAAELSESGTSYVMVTLIEATGSTPQDVGAKMIVTAEGLQHGTVGGGRVEAKAIDQAIHLLADSTESLICDWSLKADVGMTCGGRVKLFFDLTSASPWQIYLFGAGHVAQATANLLVTLPCQATCIDSREDWLVKLPQGVHQVLASNPSELVNTIPEDAFVLCMTQGHRSDLPVIQAIFAQQRKFPYLGVIGSKAKAAVLQKELVQAGIEKSSISFHCPIGMPIGKNHPSEIAISIAAQLLAERDRLADA